jgi:hypothetical protein
LPYLNSGLSVEEGDYYPAERLEWRPCVNLCMLVYRFAELCEGGNVEDVEIEEVLQIVLVRRMVLDFGRRIYCNYESVRRR